LRANYNSDAGSYLDSFSPFVLSVLAEANGPYLERKVIAETIHDRFGIDIPALVVKSLLRRTYRGGLTFSVGEEAVELTEKGRAEAPSLEQDMVQYQRRQAELNEAFLAYVAEHHPQHTDLVSDAPAKHLASYFERHAAPLVGEGLRGKKSQGSVRPGVDFLVSSFVTDLAKSNQTRFDYVVEAAKGAMLASVLLLDTSDLQDSLQDLTLVLDTPVLMDLLGFHGDIAEGATRQLLSLAQSQSARVVTFDHLLGELDGILEHVAQALRKGGRSKSTSLGYLHFTDIQASPADLAIIQAKLPDRLDAAGVEVIARPDGYYKYGLDEGKLEDLIQTKVNYFQDAARINDVTSLSSTHRLREGRRSKSLEQCRAVLVSSNINLVRGAIDFDDGKGVFPLAIATDALASVLWVRSPAAAPDAPRDILLASAFAGMQPNPNLWSKYLDEIEELEKADAVSSDEAVILRTSPTSRQSLMASTLGESDEVSHDSPLVALEKVKKEATAPLEDQVRELENRAEKASAIADSASADWLVQDRARQDAEKLLAEERKSREDLEAQVMLQADLEERKVHAIRLRAKVVAQRVVRSCVWFLRAAALALVLVMLIVFLRLPDPAGRTGVVIVGAAGIVALALFFLPPLGRFAQRAEVSLVEAEQRRRLLNAGYEEADADRLGGTK
jgi:hypothetical protein